MEQKAEFLPDVVILGLMLTKKHNWLEYVLQIEKKKEIWKPKKIIILAEPQSGFIKYTEKYCLSFFYDKLEFSRSGDKKILINRLRSLF